MGICREYAARYIDGSNWPPYNYASGDSEECYSSTTINNYCWYSDNSGMDSHNVGEKLPNALNIYDMSGNIMECCWDWYAYYPSGTYVNYKGPDSGNKRVVRSGCYDCSLYPLQTGYRGNYYFPYMETTNIGFRLARTQ